MSEVHTYAVRVRWTGDQGSGTREYLGYSRNHSIEVSGKPRISGSSDPKFHGDRTRYNPEELLVASLSACHMLWYLHLCADAGVTVVEYVDDAEGSMETNPGGGGRFTRVLLRPKVRIVSGDRDLARRLHDSAHDRCFVANSVNFPVVHEPITESADES